MRCRGERSVPHAYECGQSNMPYASLHCCALLLCCHWGPATEGNWLKLFTGPRPPQLSVRFQAALGAAYVPAAALLELLLHRYGQQQQQQQQQSALQSVAGGSGGAIPGQQGSGGSGGVAALGGWRTGCTGVGAAAASAAAWRAAAVFAVGNAVCGLVVSAVTDLAGRMASVKELRCRGTAAVVGQQQQLQDDASCRGGAVESSLSLKEKLKE